MTVHSHNMKNSDEVAIFWDYENCPAPTNTSGYAIVNGIRSVAQTFGSVTLFKAYLEITEQVPVSRGLVLRSELQSSGVSLTDCPHNGRKDVADKMILVDMLAHAIDNPAPSTIVLISGDRDFAYALSILRLRCYHVVLITLSNAHPSLRAQASLCFDWISDILEPVDPILSNQPFFPRRGKTSAPPTHHKSYSDIKCRNPSRSPLHESYNEKSPSHVEFIDYFQDQTRHREISRTSPKHDARHDFLPLDLEQSKSQPAVSSVASTALRNRPESPPRVIYSPVASSYHTYLNDSIETPLAMTSHDSNSSHTTPTSNTSGGSTPKLEPYGNIMASRFSAYPSLRGSTSLPNLAQQIASLTAPISTMRMLPVEPDLRGTSPSQQQGVYSLINAETQSLSSLNQINDHHDDLNSPSTHSDIPPPPNFITPSSTSAPPSVPPPSSLGHATVPDVAQSSFKPVTPLQPTLVPSSMPPPSLSHATVPDPAQSPVKAASPVQPTPLPAVPGMFKILIQCLKSHRSKGNLRPTRSNIAVEIAHNGATYRQAGVSKFREYTAMAEKAGIIELGGWEGTAWIALREPWYNVSLS